MSGVALRRLEIGLAAAALFLALAACDPSGSGSFPIRTTALPEAHVFEPYAFTLEAARGEEPYFWTASGLPDGLMLDGDSGTIEHRPGVPLAMDGAPRSVNVVAIDSQRRIASAKLELATAGIDSVSGGTNHSCAIDDAGAAWCWGYNNFGQLGDGSAELGSELPLRVAGGHVFTAITAGDDHTCALDDAGAAWCWGRNDRGQLGTGDNVTRGVPSAVEGGHAFVQLSVGMSFSCAMDQAGGAWCWGRNDDGQLGDGSTSDRDVPVEAAGGLGFSSISAGGWHTCALDGSGAAWCWGLHEAGRLGHTAGSGPAEVVGEKRFTQINASESHTCAIEVGGAAWCWGTGLDGRLGAGNENASGAPVAVFGGHSFTQLAPGASLTTCALASGGTVLCWGNNSVGQLGNGTNEPRSSPTPVVAGVSFVQVSSGRNHSCAVDAGGALWCWGINSLAQLGDGTFYSSPYPVRTMRPD